MLWLDYSAKVVKEVVCSTSGCQAPKNVVTDARLVDFKFPARSYQPVFFAVTSTGALQPSKATFGQRKTDGTWNIQEYTAAAATHYLDNVYVTSATDHDGMIYGNVFTKNGSYNYTNRIFSFKDSVITEIAVRSGAQMFMRGVNGKTLYLMEPAGSSSNLQNCLALKAGVWTTIASGIACDYIHSQPEVFKISSSFSVDAYGQISAANDTSLNMDNYQGSTIFPLDIMGRGWLIGTSLRDKLAFKIFDYGNWSSQYNPQGFSGATLQPSGNILFYPSQIDQSRGFTFGLLK